MIPNFTRLQSETFLRGHEHHAEIASTNDRALELCADAELPIPYLVLAERQTAGRGRGANRWWSSDGALLFSMIVDAASYGLPESRWPQVSLTAGVAVCEVLSTVLQKQLEGARRGSPDPAASTDRRSPESNANSIGLKWPNDVWLNNRKVCGILVEVPAVQRGRLVIGIGLNVNNSFATAPPELQMIATSLRDEAGSEFDRNQLLTESLRQLDADLRRLAAKDATLAERWRTLCVLRDRIVSLDTSQQLVTGRCLGITDDGALRLQTPTGEQRFYGGIVRQIV